jgi:hypothetical protein
MILFSATLIVFSAISSAIVDTISFHYNKSIFTKIKNPGYWNPEWSWRNKYKHYDPKFGERFFQSKDLLVFLTDAWHLFKMLSNTLSWIGFIILGFNIDSPLRLILLAIGFKIIHQSVFHLFFTYLLLKKPR